MASWYVFQQIQTVSRFVTLTKATGAAKFLIGRAIQIRVVRIIRVNSRSSQRGAQGNDEVHHDTTTFSRPAVLNLADVFRHEHQARRMCKRGSDERRRGETERRDADLKRACLM